MPDSPHVRLRQPNRPNRPHAGQSLDPTLTRKGTFAHPGSLLVGGGALVFFAYVFNLGGLQTWLDGLFGGLDASARSHNSEVAHFVIAAIPYLIVAFAAAILFVFLSVVSRGARSAVKERKLGKRESVSLTEFADSAAAHGVSKKVAREAYRQLLPHYHNHMRVTLKDRMTTTLHMKPVEVSELYGNLLRHTDRQRNVGDDGARLDSVLDLLKAVEESTPRSLSQSKLHERDDRAAGRPVRRRPSIGQRIKASFMRSVIRPAAPAQPQSPKAAEPSFIKPARLAVREADIKPRSAAPANETPSQDAV